MKTKFIEHSLSNKYSAPTPVSGLDKNITKHGKQYTLLGRSEKSYFFRQRAWMGIRALVATVFTLGIGLYFWEKTQSNWKHFWTGKKVVAVYTSSSTQQTTAPSRAQDPKRGGSSPVIPRGASAASDLLNRPKDSNPPTSNLQAPRSPQSTKPEEARKAKETNQPATPSANPSANPLLQRPDASLSGRKVSVIPTLPEAQNGEIKNGYGEYLIYRLCSDGQKEAITTQEYEKIYSIIENSRSLDGEEISQDRHAYLQAKIQEQLGHDVHLAFIPRTLYELIYAKQCIQEDIDKKICSHARGTNILWALQEDDWFEKFNKGVSKAEFVKGCMEKGFWQQCLFDDKDYLNNFTAKGSYDYREKHIKAVAAELNRVALSHFKKCSTEIFTYSDFKEVNHEILSFMKELHNPESELHAKVQKISPTSAGAYGGIAKDFAEEKTKVWGKADQYPMGIACQRHEQIIQKAMQLECSAEAINSFIFYRGGVFSNDKLIKEEESWNGKISTTANSLSYGTSPYAGFLYDGGGTAFHFMRRHSVDAQAFIVPMKKQKLGKTPFHFYNVHPLIQLMSRGEIFHVRTKIWNMNSKGKVSGFESTVEDVYFENCLKSQDTQEKMEKRFQKYKNKAYLLAPKG